MNYSMILEISESELNKIFAELHEAQEKIYECYSRLQALGVLRIEKETITSGN